jgi:hypothetical protein
MEKIIEYIGTFSTALGVLYFIIRFFYYGKRESFESEISKITKLQYFLLIKKTDDESESNIRVVLNLMLRTFYLMFVLAIICLFIFTILESA